MDEISCHGRGQNKSQFILNYIGVEKDRDYRLLHRVGNTSQNADGGGEARSRWLLVAFSHFLLTHRIDIVVEAVVVVVVVISVYT